LLAHPFDASEHTVWESRCHWTDPWKPRDAGEGSRVSASAPGAKSDVRKRQTRLELQQLQGILADQPKRDQGPLRVSRSKIRDRVFDAARQFIPGERARAEIVTASPRQS